MALLGTSNNGVFRFVGGVRCGCGADLLPWRHLLRRQRAVLQRLGRNSGLR